MLHELFGRIWEKDEIPDDWKEGYLVKLPKKGDLKECKNWRGIMLLDREVPVLWKLLRHYGIPEKKIHHPQAEDL